MGVGVCWWGCLYLGGKDIQKLFYAVFERIYILPTILSLIYTWQTDINLDLILNNFLLACISVFVIKAGVNL